MQIVRIVKGESCIIQAKNSQVKLHVPKGVHGAVLGKIITKHTKVLHLIPDSECIVGPICEYSVHPFINGAQIHSPEKFLLQVPHIISDATEAKSKVRVRHVDSVTREVNIIRPHGEPRFGMSCTIDENYVHILTSQFSPFLVTAEDMNCGAGRASVLLYGSLKNNPNTKPLTTVKVFFSSALCEIQDYEDVSSQSSNKLIISQNLPYMKMNFVLFLNI